MKSCRLAQDNALQGSESKVNFDPAFQLDDPFTETPLNFSFEVSGMIVGTKEVIFLQGASNLVQKLKVEDRLVIQVLVF